MAQQYLPSAPTTQGLQYMSQNERTRIRIELGLSVGEINEIIRRLREDDGPWLVAHGVVSREVIEEAIEELHALKMQLNALRNSHTTIKVLAILRTNDREKLLDSVQPPVTDGEDDEEAVSRCTDGMYGLSPTPPHRRDEIN